MFRFKLDTSSITQGLTGAQERQIPFVASLALNRVAVIGQNAEQYRILAKFKVRREQFVLRGIKINKADRATKTSWRVIIRVDQPQDFLNRTEEGDDHTPLKGKWLWKPNAAVFNDRIILRSNPLHPMNLRFDSHLRAQNRVFMVKGNGSKTGPLILQRTGAKTTGYSHRDQLRGTNGRFDGLIRRPGERRAKQGVRLLYTLVARSHVPAKLEFAKTITNAVAQAWPTVAADAMAEALRTAR